MTRKITPVHSPTLPAHPAHLSATSRSPREEVVEDIIRPVIKKHSSKSSNIPVNFELTELEFNEDISCHLKESDNWQGNHSIHDARPSSQTDEKQYYSSDEISDTHRDISIQTLPLDSISEMAIPSPPTYATAQNMRSTGTERPPKNKPSNLHSPVVIDNMSHIVQSQGSFHTSYQPVQNSNTMETPLLLLPSCSQQGPHAQLDMMPANKLNSRPAASHVDTNNVVQLNHPGIPFVVPMVEASVPPTAPHYALAPAPYSGVEELTGQLTVPDDDVHVWVDSQNRIFSPAVQPVSQHLQLQPEPDFSVSPFPGYKVPVNADPSVPQSRRKVIPGRLCATSDSGIGSNSSSRGLCIILILSKLMDYNVFWSFTVFIGIYVLKSSEVITSNWKKYNRQLES